MAISEANRAYRARPASDRVWLRSPTAILGALIMEALAVPSNRREQVLLVLALGGAILFVMVGYAVGVSS